MVLCKALGRFVDFELGAINKRETFYATDAQADKLEQMGLIERIEGKPQPLDYATKVEPSSVVPAAQASTETTSNIAGAGAGPSGEPTTATNSESTGSTPVTDGGGISTPKRRGRPPKSAGLKTSQPPNAGS